MAFNNSKYRELLANGLSHGAAKILADPDTDNIDGGAVSNPAALTAPATMGAAYTQAEVQKLRDDVANLRSTVNSLLTALRNAGVVS